MVQSLRDFRYLLTLQKEIAKNSNLKETTKMEKVDRNKKSLTGNPIKLDDLLPRDNVTGGKSKNVFGAISKAEGKRRKSS